MTYKFGHALAHTVIRQNSAGVRNALTEMYAYEQACGIRPEQTFYHYRLTLSQMEICNQYRFVVKLPDGRLCLSRFGREIAASC